jgi:hypothetical protein
MTDTYFERYVDGMEKSKDFILLNVQDESDRNWGVVA